MCKRLLLSLLVLVLISGSVHAAVMTWTGTISNDWTDGQNWNGSAAPPVAGDFLDIRSDGFVTFFPVVSTGQTASGGTIRMNPGFGTQTPSITLNGGTLNVSDIRAGDAGSGGADIIMNSGVANVSGFTAVGSDTPGQLFMNGGTFNAGTLGLPNWFGATGSSTGNAFVDGGNLNTNGILIDFLGNSPTSGIDFTKDLAAGGGLVTDTQDLTDPVDWTNWQDQINLWIGTGIISTSTGGTVQASFSSAGSVRTTLISSVAVPEPMTMTMALFAVGGLMLRRRR